MQRRPERSTTAANSCVKPARNGSISVVAPLNKEKGEDLARKYEKEVERYEGDKDDISDKAKELENERDAISRVLAQGRNPVVKSGKYWYQGPWCTQLRAYRSTCWCTIVSRR